MRRNGLVVVNFGANDYLGLAWHPELLQAAQESGQTLPKFGSGASSLVTGQTHVHENLEHTISVFKGTERSIIFSSGYAANLGTVGALVSKEDVIFSDSLNHASLIDGCRLSRAQVILYPHCDYAALRSLVREHRQRGRFAFVATDSVFSMDGDLAPLAEIDLLCHEYDMQCILDEAHATGVYGNQGRGLSEHLSVTSSRIVNIGTLSKALGCVGGFVTGQKVLIDWLKNHARSWIYSTASTIPNASAACKAISLAQNMSIERRGLAKNSTEIRSKLVGLGLEVGTGDSPIIPIYFNDAKKVSALSEQLQQRGVFVPAIRPPTVPKNRSLLRVSITCKHTPEQIEFLLHAISQSV